MSPIQEIRSSRLPERKDDKKERIAHVALAILKEGAVFFLLTGSFLLFTFSPTIILFNASLFGINALCQIGKAYFQKGGKYFSFISSLTTTAADFFTRNVVCHEIGHALAASVCYKNAKPLITLYPFKGGSTRYSAKELTAVGTYFGWKHCSWITAFAGSFAAVVSASILLIKGLGHKNQETKMKLVMTGIVSIVQHLFYALSALWHRAKSHDFVYLFIRHGWHPLSSALLLLLAPAIMCLIRGWALTPRPSICPHKNKGAALLS